MTAKAREPRCVRNHDGIRRELTEKGLAAMLCPGGCGWVLRPRPKPEPLPCPCCGELDCPHAPHNL
jgi:hypothetical protein